MTLSYHNFHYVCKVIGVIVITVFCVIDDFGAGKETSWCFGDDDDDDDVMIMMMIMMARTGREVSLCGWFFVFGFIAAVDAAALQSLLEKCPDGQFGYKCKFQCHCVNEEVCDKVTGACSGGCKGGFWGPGCQLANNCFYNNRSLYYMGTLSHTKTMYACQTWESQGYNIPPSRDGRYQHPRNYCRAMHDFHERPWCFTTDSKKKWEYCNISSCSCPEWRFGQNCKDECHCNDSSEACNSETGHCQSGCAPGWTGDGCQTPKDCPTNRYGWDCEQTCQCDHPKDCHRFSGPTSTCSCKEGFFNPPFCEPVTKPRFVYFGNEKVNPGQPTRFNCTVAARPTPYESEIKLSGPTEKRVRLVSSNIVEKYQYKRTNVFEVNYVMNNESYTCEVKTTAGTSQMTIVANVYDTPMPTLASSVEEDSDSLTDSPVPVPPIIQPNKSGQSPDDCSCPDTSNEASSEEVDEEEAVESSKIWLERRHCEALQAGDELYQKYLQSEIRANEARIAHYDNVAKLYAEALEAQNRYYNSYQQQLDLEIAKKKEAGDACA